MLVNSSEEVYNFLFLYIYACHNQGSIQQSKAITLYINHTYRSDIKVFWNGVSNGNEVGVFDPAIGACVFLPSSGEFGRVPAVNRVPDKLGRRYNGGEDENYDHGGFVVEFVYPVVTCTGEHLLVGQQSRYRAENVNGDFKNGRQH